MPPSFHTRAIIISSGDEIMTGQLLDTNSRFLAEGLVSLGILPIEHITVPDELPALTAALRRAARQANLIIISGGLGPTDGDLTRPALADVMADQLILDPAADQSIAAMLAARAREMTDRQRRQAFRPSRATSLPNTVGTAPGLHAVVGEPDTSGRADVFCLPGPPGELRPMWEREVVPRLRPDPSITVITRLLHIVGLPEAECVTRLGDLTRRDANPLVGITASGGILTLRIRFAGPASQDQAARLVDDAESRARSLLGDHVLPTQPNAPTSGSEHLAFHILDALRRTIVPATLAVVESCTGGMLGELLTSIPGSSSVFLGGYITYANQLKESLGVDPDTLREHGAVSAQVAAQMALRGLDHSGASTCLAITGVAGPDGGTPAKPVGTVHIALACKHTPPTVNTRKFLFAGDRQDIRRRAAVSALAMLHFHLNSHPRGEPKLLWEVP